MKTLAISLLLVTSMTTMTAANASAGCRAGEAATRGGAAALQSAIDRATANAQKEKSASDSAAQCLSGISAVIAGGAFPTWDSVYKAVRQRVCAYVSSQINTQISEVNGKIGQIYSTVNGTINGAIDSAGGGGIVPPINVGGGTVSSTSTGGSVFEQASNFWSTIWK